MKHIKLLIPLLAAGMMLCSCDFFRSLAGKPTSGELEQMRLQQIARQQAAKDSLAAVQAAAAAEAARQQAEQHAALLQYRYYISLGSFRVKENAEKFTSYLLNKGYDIVTVRFKTGYDTLLTGGTDSYSKARHTMDEILEFPYCPEDIYIYDTHTNMHE